jgi:hypothetical protein
VPNNDALHAYKPLLPAVKTGQPHDFLVAAPTLDTDRKGNHFLYYNGLFTK